MTIGGPRPPGAARRADRSFPLRCALIAAAAALGAEQAQAHPHVFVDGGVDFVLRDGAILEALEVTWLYDAFETLYILSSSELALNGEGRLDQADRQKLAGLQSDWSDDFEGTAHLTIDGAGVDLERPTNFDVRMLEGRLEVTFVRRLVAPTDVKERDVEVAFYEATYFYAFAVANPPRLLGAAGSCSAHVVPFNPDVGLTALQTTLFELGREETPAIEKVGALFTDRIVLQCG